MLFVRFIDLKNLCNPNSITGNKDLDRITPGTALFEDEAPDQGRAQSNHFFSSNILVLHCASNLGAEFLVDMFNDEIHDVRLNAIRIFPLLGQGVELREDQLEMVLTVLQDANLDIREGLRQILPTLRYSSAKLVRMVFNELLANLKQYPSDHGYICSCLASIGYRNSEFVAEETPSYLNIHPYLHSAEPKSDDKVYIATMALVCNAAASSPEILKIFLDFHLRHYFLYHYKYPDWFPTLETIDQKLVSGGKEKVKPHNGITARLVAFRRNCSSGKSLDLVVKALSVLSKEIMMVCEQDVTLHVTASWLKLQFRFIQKYLSVLKSYTESKSKQVLTYESSAVTPSLSQVAHPFSQYP